MYTPKVTVRYLNRFKTAIFRMGRWRRCGTCGLAGIGKNKPAASKSGSQPWAFYCEKHRYDSLKDL